MAKPMRLNFVGLDRTGKEEGMAHIVKGLRKHVSPKSIPNVAGVVSVAIETSYERGYNAGVQASRDDELFAEFITAFCARLSIKPDHWIGICEDLNIDPNKMRTIYDRARQVVMQQNNREVYPSICEGSFGTVSDE